MTELTPTEKEKAIKLVEIAMWSAVLTFIVLACFYYLDIIESSNGKLMAIAFLDVAIFDVFCVKYMTVKMRVNLNAE